MKEIKMVDLHGQYLKIKDEVDFAIHNVLDSTAYIRGPQVISFQKSLEDYLRVKHVICCANGTDALQVAMMALDLKAGDEVITSNFTFIATVEVIVLLGLKPVLVDVDPDTFMLDPIAVEKAITGNTKAIVPVHLFGQCADMESIMKIADKHGLYVIEDNAQAIGADYTFSDGRTMKAGSIGTIGCTSFFPSKNLGCYGDGGAIFTNDSSLSEKISSIVNHGMTVRYYHDHIGVNSRLDTLQAAILEIKLQHLDEYCDSRRKAADYYDEGFRGHAKISIPERSHFSSHVFHQYTLKVGDTDRDGLLSHLQSQGVACAIYYPVPLHEQKPYLELLGNCTDFPVTVQLCREVISLPMHTELDEEQQDYIINCVIEFLNRS